MVGRKPLVSAETILKNLLNFEIYDENNVLKKRTNEVWIKVCEAIGNINVVNLFNHVQQDRHNTLTFYRKYRGLEDEIVDEDSENICDFSIRSDTRKRKKIDSESYVDEDEEPNIKKKVRKIGKRSKLSFDIMISSDEWAVISPVQKMYKSGRTGIALQEGWSDIIRSLIWQNQKLPCAFSFDRHYVNSYEAYIKIEGHCTECLHKIYVICKEEPIINSPVTFNVTAIDTKKIRHQKKVRLQKLAKLNVEKEVLNQLPKQYRRNRVRAEMSYGSVEPAHLPKLTQIQNARQDAKSKDLGIKRRTDLFKSLTQLKNNVEFNKFIRFIGYDKFFIMYWSPEQISVYNDILAKLGNAVSLDATSSITLKIKRVHGDASDIFLSVMCTHIDNLIVPISQVMSEKNDTCFYNFWLQTWLQSGAKVPKELVTDMGKALQNGACLAFNSITFRMYNDLCLLILLKKETHLQLQTQMRIDIAHIEHTVTSWPCFTKENRKVKMLYIKCFGYLTIIDKLEIFQKVLQYIFIVSCSKYYDDSCQTALSYLTNIIKTHKLDLNNSSINKSYNNNVNKEEQDPDDESRLTYIYFQKLKDYVTSEVCNSSYIGVQTNDYYLPDFATRLTDLCKEFVCWTNVMNQYFENAHEVATSARNEAYFGDFKSSIKNISLRVDKVLVHHCRNIDADIKLARAAINDLKIETRKKKQPMSYYNNEHLFAVEQWRKKYSNIDFDDTSNNSTIYSNSPLKLTTQSMSQFAEAELEPFDKNSDSLKSTDVKYNFDIDSIASCNIGQEVTVNTTESQIKKENINLIAMDSSLQDHTYTLFKNQVTFHSSQNCRKILTNGKEQNIVENKDSPTKDNIKKQRGIHVRPNPDIVLRLQQSNHKKVTATKKNIANGNKQLAKQMKQQKICFTNTCAFDTITEILSSAYVKVVDFKKFIDTSMNDEAAQKHLCYANTIIKHAIQGVNNVFYTNRAHILYSLFKESNSIINCNTNIGQQLTSLMKCFECTVERTECILCGYIVNCRKITIPLPDLKIAWVNDYTNLEEELNNYFDVKTWNCKSCNNDSAQSNYYLGPYLWIDTDEAYRSSLYALQELKIEGTKFITSLDDIPKTLTIKNQSFLLCGVATYIPPIDPIGMGHYIAYCYSNDHWVERNDLVKYSKIVPRNSPKLKISGIFYVKTKFM